jgi:hypothetical protein
MPAVLRGTDEDGERAEATAKRSRRIAQKSSALGRSISHAVIGSHDAEGRRTSVSIASIARSCPFALAAGYARSPSTKSQVNGKYPAAASSMLTVWSGRASRARHPTAIAHGGRVREREHVAAEDRDPTDDVQEQRRLAHAAELGTSLRARNPGSHAVA